MKRIIHLSLTSILIMLLIVNFRDLKFQSFQVEQCQWVNIDCDLYVKELTEEAWGQAGTIAYQAAAQWMYINNGVSQHLTETQKRYLRAYFEDLVDRVVIIYNARLLDDWFYADFKIDLGQIDSIAQTYCRRIYVKDSYKPGDFGQLILLELRSSNMD